MIHPISFGIDESKIVLKIPLKKKILSNLIPGHFNTYIYNTEEEYYAEYQESLFAITTKKGGWDCMRHYEIMANGCIPYFPGLESCPPRIMTSLPKDLLLACNACYLKHQYKKYLKELSVEERAECNALLTNLLQYMRSHLTTRALAQYVLDTVRPSLSPSPKSILFLSPYVLVDYLRCNLLQGLKVLFGAECHDYPRVPHLYTDFPQTALKSLYGKGMSVTRLVSPTARDPARDATVFDDIRRHKYDLVIYGSYHRVNAVGTWGEPQLIDLVRQYYKPSEIIFVCGEDTHDCCLLEAPKNPTFIRELELLNPAAVATLDSEPLTKTDIAT